MNFRTLIVAVVLVAGTARADEITEVASSAPPPASRERVVSDGRIRIAALELCPEVTINDANATLRQLCRWPEADAATFAPYADLVLLRLPPNGSFGTITLETVRTTLRDAGLNPAHVDFAGAASCTVARSDVAMNEGDALRAWGADLPRRDVTIDPVTPPVAVEARQDLRSRLIADVADRTKLPIDTLQVDFRPEDRAILSMAAPFEFLIEPQRAGDLGETSWLITISGQGGQPVKSSVGDGRRVRITANARAWMEQVIVVRPLAGRQEIGEADVEVKRVLADRIPGDRWVTKDQAVGQQASRDCRPGTVLSGRLVSPVELVRPGQLVTILMRRGAIEVKSVARAMQSGSAGQLIKVKNETTNETFVVTVTGRQTASLGDLTPTIADVR